MKVINLNNFQISNNLPFTLIAGPCQMESEAHAMKMAESIKEITSRLKINFIYKSSFDKANRTSLSSKRGIGLDKSLKIFEKIKTELELPLLTDIHKEEQCKEVAEVVDILQIPAFLCRQTDLLVEVAKRAKIVNIKKGQFLAPHDIDKASNKVSESGNDNIMLTDRGTSFGYNTLISDMRGLKIMADLTGYPVIFDATHSVQQPSGQGGVSGGQREFVPILARSALAVGIAGLFMETHNDPDNAPSDGPCMVKLNELEEMLKIFKDLDALIKERV